MPFALPLLPALAEAAPIIALIFAGVLILDMIAHLLPSIHLPVVGSIDFGAPFTAAAHAVEHWIISNTQHLWSAVTNWIGGVAYDSYHTLEGALAAVTHLGDQIAHIVTSIVPDAISQAERDAIHWAQAHVHNVAKSLHGTEQLLKGMVADALNSAKADVAEVRATVNQIVRPALGVVEADAARLAQAVFGDAAHGIEGLEHAVSGLLATVGVALGTGAGSIESEIGAAVGAAEGIATTALDKAIGALTGEVGDAAALAREALAGGAGTLLGTIAATAAAAMALATHLDECAVTTCDGPNNLSSLLGDLAGVAEYGSLAAFVAEAISNPAGAAATFEQGAHDLYDTGSTLLNSLLAL